MTFYEFLVILQDWVTLVCQKTKLLVFHPVCDVNGTKCVCSVEYLLGFDAEGYEHKNKGTNR